MPHHRVAKCRSVARADAHRAHITPLAYALSPNENNFGLLAIGHQLFTYFPTGIKNHTQRTQQRNAPSPSRVSKTIPDTTIGTRPLGIENDTQHYKRDKRYPIIGSGNYATKKATLCPHGYRFRYPATKMEHTFTPINSIAVWYHRYQAGCRIIRIRSQWSLDRIG